MFTPRQRLRISTADDDTAKSRDNNWHQHNRFVAFIEFIHCEHAASTTPIPSPHPTSPKDLFP